MHIHNDADIDTATDTDTDTFKDTDTDTDTDTRCELPGADTCLPLNEVSKEYGVSTSNHHYHRQKLSDLLPALQYFWITSSRKRREKRRNSTRYSWIISG